MELDQYASQRDAILRRIRDALESDRRVRAAWLSGSFGRGEDDAWSDLDLHVVVADSAFPQFLDDRPALYSRAGTPLLVMREMESDSQLGARFQLVMYPGPIEVDWNIGPESRAIRPLQYRMLVERTYVPVVSLPPLTLQECRDRAQHWLSFFWAMLPIGIKFCGRGDTRRAVKQLDLHISAYIALWRLTSGAGTSLPPHSANPILEPALAESIPVVGPTITPESALAAMLVLAHRVIELHPALEALGAAVPHELVGQIDALADLAARELREHAPRPARYR